MEDSHFCQFVYFGYILAQAFDSSFIRDSLGMLIYAQLRTIVYAYERANRATERVREERPAADALSIRCSIRGFSRARARYPAWRRFGRLEFRAWQEYTEDENLVPVSYI